MGGKDGFNGRLEATTSLDIFVNFYQRKGGWTQFSYALLQMQL